MPDIDYQLMSDSIVEGTIVSLSNEPNYQTKFNLGSVQIYMTCNYNTRNKLRAIILSDRYGDVLLSQTFIKYLKRAELNFNAEQNNLSYFLTLKPKNLSLVIDDSYDYLNWRDYFDLYFIGRPQTVENEISVSYRKMLTGN